MSQQTFEEYVDEWDDLVRQITKLKDKLKPLTAKELQMRKAIHASIKQAMGDDFKEGVNDFPMVDGRTLKVGHKLTREIASAELSTAREEYSKLNDVQVQFDDLLRIKYELELREYRKLEGEAAKVFSRVVTTKESAPTVEIK